MAALREAHGELTEKPSSLVRMLPFGQRDPGDDWSDLLLAAAFSERNLNLLESFRVHVKLKSFRKKFR